MILAFIFFANSLAHPDTIKASPPPLLPNSRYATAEPEDERYPERYFWTRQPIMPAEGLMLASGFERGFIAAGASANTTGLVVLTNEAETLSHVRVNAELITRLDFQSYSRLRNKRDECAETLAMRLVLERDEVQAFYLCSERLATRFFRRLDPAINYWTNEKHFQRLAEMGKQQRIVAQPIRFFSSGEPLQKMVRELQDSHEVIASVLLGAGVRFLMHNEGLDEGTRSLRKFLGVLKPILAPGALALYTHPVKNAVDPYYETVEISKLLRLDDRSLAEFFLSDCEVDLESSKS